jgi:hypothetical protein
VNVYLVSLSKSVTVHVSAPVVEHVAPSGAVTLYPVIGEPPVNAGADQTTVAEASPAVATTLRGAEGTVAGVAVTGAAGVAALDGVDGLEIPASFVAVTVNV